jgi:hypothetical protein
VKHERVGDDPADEPAPDLSLPRRVHVQWPHCPGLAPAGDGQPASV